MFMRLTFSLNGKPFLGLDKMRLNLYYAVTLS